MTNPDRDAGSSFSLALSPITDYINEVATQTDKSDPLPFPSLFVDSAMDTPSTLVDKKVFTSRAPTIVEEEHGTNEGKCSKDIEKQATLADPDTPEQLEISSSKRFATVFIVCFAQFFDIFASASTIISTPKVSKVFTFQRTCTNIAARRSAIHCISISPSFHGLLRHIHSLLHPSNLLGVACPIYSIQSRSSSSVALSWES